MLYYSTNRKSPAVNFKEAAISGLAPDGGLYFPAAIPELSDEFIHNIGSISNAEIAYQVIKPYVGDMIDDRSLFEIVEDTLDFEIPLRQISDRIWALELFHGPTLAFKDVGARFMSRCLGYFLKDESRKVTVLVATSGDTGGAVASGFYNVPNINVVILYPSGKVSPVQEQQLTTSGGNITALEIDGNFDDCQHMVKSVFSNDHRLPNLFLTSANSINIARWLPQQFYYFMAYKQWKDKSVKPVISVPSGNFGNICAGMLARKLGLPLGHFIAACNANDIIPRYLETDEYIIHKAIPTISNAMDVAQPSNFVRILEMYHGELNHLKEDLSAVSVTDEQTKHTLKKIYQQYGYLADPHGAVGIFALEKYAETHPDAAGIFVETAHPVKFPDVVDSIIGHAPEPPSQIHELMKLEKRSIKMNSDPESLFEYLSTI